jgi:hypothetical protein
LNQLSEAEKKRLSEGITVAYSIPFIDDIEDFIWEAIFAHVRMVPLVDPLSETREKKLFDLVDKSRKIGWSAKALQTNVRPGGEFELVIQRADIFKKAADLGFAPLSVSSPPALLGKALMKHWLDQKIKRDMAAQGVDDPRVCILLKSVDRTRFTFVEQPLEILSDNELEWRWTDDKKSGLQGWKGDQLKFRWYHGQTQFFERFRVPADAPIITLNPKRLSTQQVISALHTELSKT